MLRLALTCAVTAVCGLCHAPDLWAQAAEDAAAHAGEGATHFKAGRYLKAARAFEKAVRIDPSNRVYLRYVGRAWQEVGHIERARRMLQLYMTLETDEKLRESIAPKVKVLEAATPKVVADELLKATRKHPMGRLEADTAAAFARLDDEESLKLALTLYEAARLSAPTDKKREEIDSAMKKIRTRLDELTKKGAGGGGKTGDGESSDGKTGDGRTGDGKTGDGKTGDGKAGGGPAKPKEPQSDGLGTALYVIGGALLLGGGGLSGWGYVSAAGANDEWAKDKDLKPEQRHYKTFADYESDKESGDTMNLIGAGVAGVGGAVLVWALIRSATGGGDSAAQAWYVAPGLGRAGTGLALGGRF